MKLPFIDVGQGAATLAEFPCAAALVDTDGERFPGDASERAKFDSTSELTKCLDDKIHMPLQLLVLTHPHIDYTRGVGAVLRKYRPTAIVHNRQWRGSGVDGQNEARDYVRASDGDARGVVHATPHHTQQAGADERRYRSHQSRKRRPFAKVVVKP